MRASHGITDDNKLSGHGFGRRSFELSGRLFVVSSRRARGRPPWLCWPLNELLGSLEVEPGDFYPGLVEPPRLTPREGWFVGDSGPTEVDADGEFATAWAATIPLADDWNALPPSQTLRDLPRQQRRGRPAGRPLAVPQGRRATAGWSPASAGWNG